MSVEKRRYVKRQRAQLEARTRRRITESAVALHGTLGPARTSISAIADHAGVRRSTVYRHFPDEDALFAACSAHWAAENPVPDLARWATIADADTRLVAALEELYAFYGANEAMLGNVLRDESVSPAVGRTFAAFREYLGEASATLVEGRPAARRRRVAAAVAHALSFTTWRSLVREQGLDDRGAAALMADLVAVATSAPSAARRRGGSSRR